jgi:phosphomannomutase
MLNTAAFKAYDIRGKVPGEVNEELAYRVGKVFCALFGAENVVVGYDIRLTGPSLTKALSDGLRDGGANVIDIGQCGTEMIYFATAYLKTDGGIMVTASHNPAEYNGMKLVRRDARPVSADTGLEEIREMVGVDDFPHHLVAGKARGILTKQDIMMPYVEHLAEIHRYIQAETAESGREPRQWRCRSCSDAVGKTAAFHLREGEFRTGRNVPARRAESDA